jgi:hypothetical protein
MIKQKIPAAIPTGARIIPLNERFLSQQHKHILCQKKERSFTTALFVEFLFQK